MALSKYLNPEQIKADRLLARLNHTSVVSDRKLRTILKKRYESMSLFAEQRERLITIHQNSLFSCDQMWDGGTAVGISVSCKGIGVEGTPVLRVSFLPTSEAGRRSLLFLKEEFDENQAHERRLDRRLAIMSLRRNMDRDGFLQTLMGDPDSLELLMVYRSALLVKNQHAHATPALVSKFIARKLRESAEHVECDHTGCLFGKSTQLYPLTALLFDLKRASDPKDELIQPRSFNGERGSASLDELPGIILGGMDNAFLEARKNDLLLYALTSLPMKTEAGRIREKFEKLMRGVFGNAKPFSHD